MLCLDVQPSMALADCIRQLSSFPAYELMQLNDYKMTCFASGHVVYVCCVQVTKQKLRQS